MANPAALVAFEKVYMQHLLAVLEQTVKNMYTDFNESAGDLLPFWLNYPPEQRGRNPKNEATPMLELGEKLTSSHLIHAVSNYFGDVTFPGLPTGGDVRFATSEALVHLDIKVSGPNETPNDLVVPPNQVSGDGANANALGILNSTTPITTRTGNHYDFQPKLPPFYLLGGRTLLCLTFYLKVIYDTEGYGIHPLRYFELVCVPNGLLMFDGPQLYRTTGLLAAGKDESAKPDSTKRMRVKLIPLSKLDPWRTVKIERPAGQQQWHFYSRGQPKAKLADLFK